MEIENGNGKARFTTNRIIMAAVLLGLLVGLSYLLMGNSSSGTEEVIKDTKPAEAPPPPPPVIQQVVSQDCADWTGFKRAGLLNVPKVVKKLIINIGSWKDPPISGDVDTYTISIEPELKTAQQIRDHPKLFVITAAVSNVEGLSFMHAYGAAGETSSLSHVNDTEPWDYVWAVTPKGYPPFQFVPVLSLKTILESIPEHITITQLKTDMQGHDFTAIQHAGKSLRRVASIYSEVNCNGFQTYETIKNDFTLFKAFMPTVGFVVNWDPCGTARKEADATFTRDDKWVDPDPSKP